MSSPLQQLSASGQQLLAETKGGIEDDTLDALVTWLDKLQQVLQHPPEGQPTREDLEQILSVNEAITALVMKNRDELGTGIKQTRTGIDAVKAYQGKS
jgi:hypothetical protein